MIIQAYKCDHCKKIVENIEDQVGWICIVGMESFIAYMGKDVNNTPIVHQENFLGTEHQHFCSKQCLDAAIMDAS
jgi:hypothetical protein